MKKLLTAIAIILLWAGFAWGASLSGVSVSGVAVNNDQWYGITWNESTDAYTRTGATAGYPTGATINDYAALPIQGNMRRCVLQDDGDVAYYLCPTDSTLKEDCATAANLDGTDGQVMVEIPKFYIRYSYAANVHSWDVSPVLLPGFEAHPAFYKDGAWVDYRYIGAYEGSLWDDDTSAMYSDADAVTQNTYDDGDKLCSITGQCPKTYETRAEFREAASDRGAGWRNQDYYLTAAVQLLYLTEYADFDSQSLIGTGRTYFSNGSWVIAGVGGYIGRTGYSNSDGNATNATNRTVILNIAAIDTSQAAYQDYMSYRGIENFYGNVWKFVDGWNVWNYDDDAGTAYSRTYACNNEANYANDTATNYTLIGAMWEADGYPGSLVQIADGFLPAGAGGSSATYLCDYYYTYFNNLTPAFDSWRVVRFGEAAASTVLAGAFCVDARDASASDAVHVGGRLCY